jgi:hypothetical protein
MQIRIFLTRHRDWGEMDKELKPVQQEVRILNSLTLKLMWEKLSSNNTRKLSWGLLQRKFK